MKASEIIARIKRDRETIEFIPTGFQILDRELDGGFLRKELVILGAFTGIGKSIFGGQILYQIAQKGFSTAYFSLEISNGMILSRLIGQHSNIKPTRIIAGLLTPQEYENKVRVEAEIMAHDELMEFYDDKYLFKDLIAEIKKNKYEFIVIDFIQNIQLENNMDEYTRLTFISIQLQKIAKENDCCIMILSQLSNKVARDGAKSLEFKGSGAIAMVADLALILRREESVGMDGDKQHVKLELMKNRRGISGKQFLFSFLHPGGKIYEG